MWQPLKGRDMNMGFFRVVAAIRRYVLMKATWCLQFSKAFVRIYFLLCKVSSQQILCALENSIWTQSPSYRVGTKLWKWVYCETVLDLWYTERKIEPSGFRFIETSKNFMESFNFVSTVNEIFGCNSLGSSRNRAAWSSLLHTTNV